MLRDKYLEVWNKVDLISEDQEKSFQEKVEWAAQQENDQVVLMSCTEGFNKDLFLEKVGEMSADLKGKRLYKLEYASWEHGERLNWLRKNALIADITDRMEVSPDGQVIKLEVLLDDVIFNRYLKEFEPEVFAENKSRSRKAPQGW